MSRNKILIISEDVSEQKSIFHVSDDTDIYIIKPYTKLKGIRFDMGFVFRINIKEITQNDWWNSCVTSLMKPGKLVVFL